MRQIPVLLAIIFVLSCCSSGETGSAGSNDLQVAIPEHLQDVENLSVIPADAEPMYEMELVREASYGDKYDDVVYLGYINDFAVDDNGRVYLADSMTDQIQVYNPDGSFLRTIGRSGRGPGEFLTVYSGLDLGVNDDYLFVYDETNMRVSRFTLDTNDFVDMALFDPDAWSDLEDNVSSRPRTVFRTASENYLVNFGVVPENIDQSQPFILNSSAPPAVYYLFNPDLKPVSGRVFQNLSGGDATIAEIEGQPTILSYPFFRKTIFALSEQGTFYRATTNEFLIEAFDSTGTYERTIFHDLSPVSLTESDIDSIAGKNRISRLGLREVDVPETWPSLDLIKVDNENRLWVLTVTESNDHFEWLVLDENDQLLGRVPWLDNKTAQRSFVEHENIIIKNGALYYLSSDAMNLDAQTVIKYRIEMTPR